MKIVIAGATGFVGRALAAALQRDGHAVVALSRDTGHAAGQLPGGVRAVEWDARTAGGPWAAELRGAEAAINLAGASIGTGRWSEARKRVLTESRVRSNAALVEAMAALPTGERPRTLASASGIDYYGHHAGDEPVDEQSPAGTSFLAQLCVQWEAAARQAEPLGVRVALVRTAFVVGRGAIALRMLALPFQLFAGGPLGSGRQWFTWIHLHDLVGLYTLAIAGPDGTTAGTPSGAINAVAPGVLREREVAQEIGRALRRPSWMPAPAFGLRLVLGEMADLLLHGRRAVPAKAEAAGYRFQYPALRPALAEALGTA